ncbi:MAG: hypothetical protein KJZ59_05570 [Pararhodobacter sp.]|nr:hypothetical protein [Pararhodobacter sp.]
MPPIDPVARLSILVSLALAALIMARARLVGLPWQNRPTVVAAGAWLALALWQAWRAFWMQPVFVVQAALLPLLGWLTWRALRVAPDESDPTKQ